MFSLVTLKAKLIAVLGGIVALMGLALTFYYKGRKSKAIEVEAQTAKTVIEVTKKDKEVEKTIDRMSASAKRDELRKLYTSDPD